MATAGGGLDKCESRRGQARYTNCRVNMTEDTISQSDFITFDCLFEVLQYYQRCM